jgi:hypothetical protein
MHAPLAQQRRGARILLLIVVAGSGLSASTPVLAELSTALDRISIAVGVFQADPTLDASVNTPYGKLQSGEINMGKETMPRVKANLILFDSQGLSFDCYQYKHGYAGTVANNFAYNGTAFATTGSASLDIKLDFAKLAYKWWIGSGDTVIGLGAGAAYYKIALDARATAAVNSTTAAVNNGYSDDAVAPLLEIGLRHAISQDLRFFVDASGVKKTGGLLNGEIYNGSIGVEWFPVKNVGVALDYGVTQVDLRRDDSISENVKVRFQGPSAFLKVRF